LLVGQLAWLMLLRSSRSPGVFVGGAVALQLPAIVIAALLTTTPRNAIKLRSATSERVVIGGVLLRQLLALVLLRPQHALVVAAAVVVTTIALLVVLRRAGLSPWWATPVVWNPLLIVLITAC
jgi:hypothetical protein